jgi:TRAP-type C4-dicarboxylate transport system permease large subunit
LGCILDVAAMILITIPIVFPIVTNLGFDPIWFGVFMVRVGEIGMITPPVGMNVFALSGVIRDVPLYTIFRGVLPFLIADICHVALLVTFPQIALFLPNLMVN